MGQLFKKRRKLKENCEMARGVFVLKCVSTTERIETLKLLHKPQHWLQYLWYTYDTVFSCRLIQQQIYLLCETLVVV